MATVQWVVGGEPATVWVVEGEELVEERPGAVDDPDLTLTMTAEERRLVDAGDVDEQALFMQGRLKVAGHHRVLLAALKLTRTR